MPNQSSANIHPFANTFPTPPWDAPDPLPVMRREMKLLLIELNVLRIEVEQLRAADQEAHKTKESLSASVDRIMESRDKWQREAERLSPPSSDAQTIDRLCLARERCSVPVCVFLHHRSRAFSTIARAPLTRREVLRRS